MNRSVCIEGTVIPWLKKISMALKAFAQVLGANAQAQDEVSSGASIDLTALPRYTSPTLLAVAGPLVFLWDETHDRTESLRVLDTRSDVLAGTRVTKGDSVYSAGGHIATYDSKHGPVRFDTTDLAPLTCR